MVVRGFVDSKSNGGHDGKDPKNRFGCKINSEGLSSQPKGAMKGTLHPDIAQAPEEMNKGPFVIS